MKPTKKQLEFLDWELGVFFHFGIRTFYEGRKDWEMDDMPLEGFCPSELDCEDWIRTIKEAGAKYAILVCKHHDGFANWPSKYTEYSVKNTQWKNGEGDVVREYVDACRKYNIKVGLYYSPADIGIKSRTAKEHDDFFINQIDELLTNYGKIDYLWFDGCGSEGHKYDEERIIKEIRQLQPGILIFNMWDPDTRWVGNEKGIASWDNKNVTDSIEFSVLSNEEQVLGGLKFLPAECDCTIRFNNWFYSDSDLHTLKSVEELMGIYDYSIGRGANLLINISPDRRGLLPEEDKNRFLEFGNKIKKRFASPIPIDVEKQSNTIKIRLKEPACIHEIMLKEDLTEGENVKRFQIRAMYLYAREPVCIFEGATIGHKRLCIFPLIHAEEIELEVLDSNGAFDISDIQVF